jgi:CBS domain-containing protein
MINGFVQNWMSSPVVTVSPETCLTEARQLVSDRRIRALPVVKDDRLVGIITHRGLLRRDLSFLGSPQRTIEVDISREKIGSFMTANPITITPQTLIPKAARIMLENKITALPVLENGQVTGILTNSDVLRFIIIESATLKKQIKVDQYMTAEVVTIDPDTSLLEAHRLMGIKRIRSLPVMDGEKLVGLVTRTDLMSSDPSRLTATNQQDFSLRILTQPVEKIMTSDVITINPDLTLVEAARLMLDNKVHCLVIVNRQRKLAGIISESDLFLMVVQKFL